MEHTHKTLGVLAGARPTGVIKRRLAAGVMSLPPARVRSAPS